MVTGFFGALLQIKEQPPKELLFEATKHVSRVLYWEAIYLRPASPPGVKPYFKARRAAALP